MKKYTLFTTVEAHLSSSEQQIPKSVGAGTQPCLTLLGIQNGSNDDPSHDARLHAHVERYHPAAQSGRATAGIQESK